MSWALCTTEILHTHDGGQNFQDSTEHLVGYIVIFTIEVSSEMLFRGS